MKQSRKIYFWDLGIRNAVIANFTQIENRTDVGAMWENFVVSERIKLQHIRQQWTNTWFWRTQQQKEIDLIEEENGELSAFEFKWNPSKANVKMPDSFTKAYPDTPFKVITKDNVDEFLL